MDDIFVTRPSMPPIGEYVDEIKSIWETYWLTNMGEKHNTFQKQLRTYLACDNLELLVNGHMSLELTLQAFELKGEVITTPFTFASTTHAIIRNGLEPVFCDIDENDFTVDVSKIEALINDKTCAILPVHVYGNICEVEKIQELADRYDLKVIYDAAHAFGETYEGKSVASFGDASCFSFHATKVFNSIEGGAVAYKNAEIGKKIYDLKNFGIHGPEEVCAIGANAKMNEFCAAMGICNLKHIGEEIEKRRIVDERYQKNLAGVPGIKMNEPKNGVKRNYGYFPVLIERQSFGCDRNAVKDALEKEGIFPRKQFFPLTCDYAAFGNRFKNFDVPVARKVSESVLTLPLYAGLSFHEVDRICEIIKARGIK